MIVVLYIKDLNKLIMDLTHFLKFRIPLTCLGLLMFLQHFKLIENTLFSPDDCPFVYSFLALGALFLELRMSEMKRGVEPFEI